MKRLLPVLVLLLCSPAGGDVVHLKTGGKLEGRVTDLGEKVRVETAAGAMEIPKDQVERIEKREYKPPERKKEPAKAPEAPHLPVRLESSYAHPFHAFKILLPSGWKVGKTHGKAAISFYGPKDEAYYPRIDMFIQKSATPLTKTVSLYKDGFRKAFPDAAFVSEQARNIGEQSGYQFTVMFKDGQIAQQALWTFVLSDGRLFVVSFHCTQSWFPRYLRRVDATMKSLRIFPRAELSEQQWQAYSDHYNRAERAYRAKSYDEAFSQFQKAAEILPDWPEIHGSIGTVLMRLNRLDEAVKAFLEATRLDPSDRTHNYNLGVALLKLDRNRDAVKHLSRARDLDPFYGPAHTNLGVAFLSSRKFKEARDALERAVKISPESPPAHYNLGLALEELGLKDDARRQFKDTLSLDPDHSGAKEALTRLK